MYKYPHYLKFLIVILFVATLFYTYYYFNNIFSEAFGGISGLPGGNAPQGIPIASTSSNRATVVKELTPAELSILELTTNDINTIKGYNLTNDQLTAMYKLFSAQLNESANKVNQQITDLVTNVTNCNNNLNGNASLNIKGAIPLNNELKGGLQKCNSELVPLQTKVRDFSYLIAAQEKAFK